MNCLKRPYINAFSKTKHKSALHGLAYIMKHLYQKHLDYQMQCSKKSEGGRGTLTVTLVIPIGFPLRVPLIPLYSLKRGPACV